MCALGTKLSRSLRKCYTRKNLSFKETHSAVCDVIGTWVSVIGSWVSWSLHGLLFRHPVCDLVACKYIHAHL
jgi:hypothetical protein